MPTKEFQKILKQNIYDLGYKWAVVVLNSWKVLFRVPLKFIKNTKKKTWWCYKNNKDFWLNVMNNYGEWWYLIEYKRDWKRWWEKEDKIEIRNILDINKLAY